MSSSLSALDASSYQHPVRGGPFEKLREVTVLAMMEQGIEYNTLSENPLSWADDQDPFGHVMAQAYAHYSGNCFIRILESFQVNLKDEFPKFMSGKSIGPMTNKISLKIMRVVKYPDTLIAGARILDVRWDRFFVTYYIWSVAQKALVATLDGWVVFFDHKEKRKVNLAEENPEYRSLHDALIERSAESRRVFEAWEKKQAQKTGSMASKL